MRFDLSYPGLRLIIEYDGGQHAENSGQWRRDLIRREELNRLRWRRIVITSDDLREAPEAVLIRVREALIDRGAGWHPPPLQDGVDGLFRSAYLIVSADLVRNVRFRAVLSESFHPFGGKRSFREPSTAPAGCG
jgi:hypothetical protein